MNDFEKKMSSSPYGMRTSVWGKAGWVYIGCVARFFPVKDPSRKQKKRYGRFISDMKTILPCGKCQHNMRKHLREINWKVNKMHYLSNRDSYSRLVHQLQNIINQHTGKKPTDYESWVKVFDSFRATCDPKDPSCTKDIFATDEHVSCVLHVAKGHQMYQFDVEK